MTEEKDEMIIDTSKMSEGKRAALELAEGSRDKLLTRSTLAGSLFMGNLLWEDIYPWPEQAAEDQLIIRRLAIVIGCFVAATALLAVSVGFIMG